MNRHFSIFIIIVFLVVGLYAQSGKLKFVTVTKELDASKKTSLYVKNYWSKVSGTEVTWTGKVKDVKGSRGKATIFVVNKNARTYKGFNIVVTTFNVDAAASLEIGQKIRFSGLLNKYKSKKGGGVVLYVTEGEILKKK